MKHDESSAVLFAQRAVDFYDQHGRLMKSDVTRVCWRKTMQPGKIYFIEALATGRVKIGFSLRPWARLKKHQTSSPYKLRMLAVVPGGPRCERRLHRYFRELRLRPKHEWFLLTGPLAKFIKLAAKAKGWP